MGSLNDDRTAPSKNLCVWNRSVCANPFYGDQSLICTQCWLSSSKLLNQWERSSELPESFRPPLSASIRAFPVPTGKDIKSRAVYCQEIVSARVSESLTFWCSDTTNLIASLRTNAVKHNLSLTVELQGRVEGEVHVAIRTRPNP